MIDGVFNVPPCVACGSTKVKRNGLRADWAGTWKGYWVCENDHKNIFK